MPGQPHDEDGAFAALDAYLDALHAGRTADRGRLLADHPHLHDLLSCLDSLDRLAPQSANATRTLPPLHAEIDEAKQPFTQFGKFELLGELGRGGMGVVYKARQPELDRLVAIKMILASSLASPEEVQRFQIEARAAAKLRHPNIVQVHEAGELHGQQFFVMEYIEGLTLAEAVADSAVSHDDAPRLIAPIARAVDYLHRQGILHRDLKPSNVLLAAVGHRPSALGNQLSAIGSEDGGTVDASPAAGRQPMADGRQPNDEHRPMLMDFGLAKLMESSSGVTRTGAIVGTPSYMAPEQAAGKHREVGPRADVFSLGAILYHVLTRRPPFHAETPLDTLVQVIEREPAPPRKLNPMVPAELEIICLKCLEKDPERRYESAAALADDLERFECGEAIAARPHGVGQRLWRWARTAPALAARLISLIVFAIIIHAVYLAVHPVGLGLHLSVLGLLGGWAGASYLFHRGMKDERQANLCRYLWAAVDAAFLTAVLGLTDNGNNPVVIFYALLIVGAGLWFQVPLVWFTTFLAELGYAILMTSEATRQAEIVNPQHQFLFMPALAVLGYMVAYQVKRVRALSRYYEQRPLA
jgi:serine/threonine-protein kinase